MKTVMILGGQGEVRPFAHAMHGVSYEALTGVDHHVERLRPSDAHVFMESGNPGEVLQKARDYAVAGILGIDEAASLAAAYAAQQLGLPGVPYAEEQLFHNLLLLRSFQQAHGLQAPRYLDLSHSLYTGDLVYPLYVSPADGPVLQYMERVDRQEDLAAARLRALGRSPGKVVIAQEHIVSEGAGEAMLVMAELVVRGGVLQPILWCEAVPDPRPQVYVPVAARYPARVNDITRMLLENACMQLVTLLHLVDAQLPVLALCMPGSVPYLIRVGVRDGAYVMTRFYSRLYRRDLLQDVLRIAVGDPVTARQFRAPAEGTCRVCYSIRTPRTGILRHIHFDRSLHRFRKGFYRVARQSQMVYAGNGMSEVVGTLVLRFPNERIMDEMLGRMAGLITVEIDDPGDGW